MKFAEALKIIGDQPLITSDLLPDTPDIPIQLSRWTASGRICRLRRGLYALNPPFQRVRPHPFFIANRLVADSYVSLNSSLIFHGLLACRVGAVYSVTGARPRRWNTGLGAYVFRHLKEKLIQGYEELEVAAGQRARVARPEKALVDLL